MLPDQTVALEKTIASQLANVQADIEAACLRSKRDPKTVKLVAVTKQRSPAEIVAALSAGVAHLGENRIEEAGEKIPLVLEQLAGRKIPAPTWHMIGHVQSRKAQDVIDTFQVIHSLESLKLARRYDNFANELGRTPAILLECNVSGEDAKMGFPADQWQSNRTQRDSLWESVQAISAFSHIQLAGLMTMAPYYAEPEQTRPVFAALRQLRDALANDFPQLALAELSMGMTNDYPIAIEEGATLVRIGRAIFGERPY